MSIEVINLSKFFGEQAAVNSISFSIKKGEVVGFLGPNGAGKSTTMKMITGFIPASQGKALINGIQVHPDHIKTRSMVGYLPESNPLYYDMYVKEYLRFVGSIYRVPKLKTRIQELIEMVGLQVEQHKKIGALSKGYKQRVGLAQAFIHDPEVLILDEPTSGLDPNQILEIRELIKHLGQHKTILLSTHIMQEVEAICDRVIIINQGKIVADQSRDELKQNLDKESIYVEFDRTINAAELKKIDGIKSLAPEGKGWLLQVDPNKYVKRQLAQLAKEKDWLTIAMKNEERGLEDLFKELTKKK